MTEIGFLGCWFLALDIRGRRTGAGQHCNKDRTVGYQTILVSWDTHQAFRPCVLFLENVPAETL